MRTRYVAAVLGCVLAGPAWAFDPTLYVGTWTGKWKNSTFKVNGTFGGTVTAAQDGSSMMVGYLVSSLFNCGQSGTNRTLVRGTDYTDAGLNAIVANDGWGPGATFTSVTTPKAEKIKASGVPNCRADISLWTIKAKLTPTKLSGKMKIKFSAGKPKTARDSFSATKS